MNNERNDIELENRGDDNVDIGHERERNEWHVVARSEDEEEKEAPEDHHQFHNEEGIHPIKNIQKSKNWMTSLTTFCGISVAAVLGVFIRIGFGYYKIWKIETNYSLMYCQIVGCFIMGYSLKLKLNYYENTHNEIIQILFTSLTTGLCGSITSFSGWQIQCNRNFFLQWDYSWGNIGGSYNGGRLFEWLVCMWGGIVVPLSALHLGFYMANLIHPPMIDPLEKSNTQQQQQSRPSTPSSSSSSSSPTLVVPQTVILIIFVLTISLVVLIPMFFYPNWIFLSYSAVFGVCGAYLRYLLSDLNTISPLFPYGTFLVNVLGTWIAALLLLLSRYFLEYYDTSLHSLLYGLLTGFCGALTTVSTLVKELDTLPSSEAYLYSFATHSFSQFGLILILNLHTYSTIPPSSVTPLPPINMCSSSSQLCSSFLEKINCPSHERGNVGCNSQDYSHFQGGCSCGSYQTDRINLILIDSQIKANITNNMALVWPTHPLSTSEPTEVYDFCLTFENICDHFFQRIDCPVPLRKSLSCDRRGLANFQPICECGQIVATHRIKDVLTDVSLARRYDLLPYLGYPTLVSIHFEEAYVDLCSHMLDHIQCPPTSRCVRGNQIYGNYSTWLGLCICNYHTSCETLEKRYITARDLQQELTHSFSNDQSFPNPHQHNQHRSSQDRVSSSHPQVDFSIRIAKNIFDSLLKPNYQLLLVQFNATSSSSQSSSSSSPYSPSPYSPPSSSQPSSSTSSSQSSSQSPSSSQSSSHSTGSSGSSQLKWDLCASYFHICLFFLEKINCPYELQFSNPCGVPSSPSPSPSPSPSYDPITGEYLYPHGKIQNVTSYCRCGAMSVLDSRSFELVITGLLQQEVNEEYTYLPPPVAPYSLAISSDPFKQLTQPRHILPHG